MAPESGMVTCYNRGCSTGNKFDPKENSEGCCTYHPGVPIFHDSLKGWSCCKKRVTDFTEFLNLKGCTTGKHSNVKPPEPVKQEKPKEKEEMFQLEVKPNHRQATPAPEERPSEDDPLVDLKVSVAASLTQQLNKLSLKDEEEEKSDPSVIKIGTSCQNKGCNKSYEGEHCLNQSCVYHPGTPIFHEGLKFWSCCQRKTSDFEAFLSQEGCTTGTCNWIKPMVSEAKSVRVDWHQTSTTVCISAFAKVAVPQKTTIKANKVKIELEVVYEGGKSSFSRTFVLREAIDVERSTVNLLGTKVELNLRKASSFSWPSLEMPPPKDTAQDS